LGSAKNSIHPKEQMRGKNVFRLVADQNSETKGSFSVDTTTVQGGLLTQVPPAGAFVTGRSRGPITELGASTPSHWVWAQAANSPGHSGRQLLIIP